MSHPEWCDKTDDPGAVALWKSDRPALLTVWCGKRRHRLARVYDMPDGEMICLPSYTFRAQTMELGDVDHGTDDAHGHAILRPLPLADGKNFFQQCSCGTWLIRAGRISDARRGSRENGYDLLAEWTGTPER